MPIEEMAFSLCRIILGIEFDCLALTKQPEWVSRGRNIYNRESQNDQAEDKTEARRFEKFFQSYRALGVYCEK